MRQTYYRVCDRCGHLQPVAPHDLSDYTCAACGSMRGWEFPKQTKALQHSRDIRGRLATCR